MGLRKLSFGAERMTASYLQGLCGTTYFGPTR